MLPFNDNTRACVLMAASMAGFTVNDVIVKSLTATLPTGQIMVLRGVIMAFLLLVWIRWRMPGIDLKKLCHPMVGLRTMGEAIATVFFLYALARVPFASVSAVLQALPLAVTLGAALVFGDRVGWRRITAILVGFFGVMLVIKPGAETFNPAILAVLATVLFATIRDLSTRALPGDIASVGVSLVTTLAVAVVGFLLMTFGPAVWAPVTGLDALLLLMAAVFLFVGYQGIIMAMRLGETAIVAPFRYTSLLWAILLGFVIFAEVPDTLSLLGAAIIVASGIYTIWREARLKTLEKHRQTTPAGRGT